MPRGTTVHGLVVVELGPNTYDVVAYGGRYVVVYRMTLSSPIGFARRAVRAVPKWVLAVDGQRIPGEYGGGVSSLLLAVGTIDGAVEVCRVDGATGAIRGVGARQVGPRRCLLYSMDLVGFVVEDGGDVVYDVRVAGGTVLFDVLVWRFEVVALGERTGTLSRSSGSSGSFGGHTGSVHCVCWDAGGERLASGSDDRTVRVWVAPWARGGDAGGDVGGSSGVFRHAARVWSLRFDDAEGVVYSGCEDGCVRGWGTGNRQLAQWGSGKGVRVIRVCGRMVLTGGADGSVRVWDADGGMGRTTVMCVEVKAMKAMKAMCLIEGGRRLLVATDDGNLVDMDVDDMDDVEDVRVVYASSSHMPLVTVRHIDAGYRTIVACCDARGALHVLWFGKDEPRRPAARVVDAGSSAGHRRMIDAFFVPHGKRVVLLCYTADGSIELYDVSEPAVATPPVASCVSPLGCRVTAVGFAEAPQSARSTTFIATGSAKGGVAVWRLADTGDRLALLAHHTRGHGETPVQTATVTVTVGATRRVSASSSQVVIIETTAADFCIQRYTLDDAALGYSSCGVGGSLRSASIPPTPPTPPTPSTPRGTLARNNAVRLDAIKTICRTVDGQSGRYVVGFFATRCIVWDRELDVQVAEFDGAGWRRLWALHVDALGETLTYCYTTGVGDVHVFKRQMGRCPPYAVVAGGHGREINSVVDVGGTLITAGADARLFAARWRETASRSGSGNEGFSTLDARCISTQPFGTSTRVLRALVTSPTTRLVVSGGARSVMTAWRVTLEHHATQGTRIEYLSAFANPAVRARDGLKSSASLDTVDMRVTALALAMQSDGPIAIIGLSTGEVEVRRVPLAHTHRKLHDWELVGDITTAYPVLSLAYVGSTVWAGTTNGDLVAWDLRTGLTETYAAVHMCGVNAMVAMPEIGAIITGGDDQALGVFDIHTRSQRCIVPNAHASAIRDVASIGGRVCSVGLDQYLRIWDIPETLDETPACRRSTMLQVQEPAACCVSSDTTTTAAITVVGRGIERVPL